MLRNMKARKEEIKRRKGKGTGKNGNAGPPLLRVAWHGQRSGSFFSSAQHKLSRPLPLVLKLAYMQRAHLQEEDIFISEDIAEGDTSLAQGVMTALRDGVDSPLSSSVTSKALAPTESASGGDSVLENSEDDYTPLNFSVEQLEQIQEEARADILTNMQNLQQILSTKMSKAENELNNCEHDYTMNEEHSYTMSGEYSPASELKPVQQEFQDEEAEINVRIDYPGQHPLFFSTRQLSGCAALGIGEQTMSATPEMRPPTGTDLKRGSDQEAAKATTASVTAPPSGSKSMHDYEEDVRAVFRSYQISVQKSAGTEHGASALLDFGKLRSVLLDHGFTAKQSSWILTRLEDEQEIGRCMISLERLRTVLIPILQECEVLIESHLTKAPHAASASTATDTQDFVTGKQDCTTSASLDDSFANTTGTNMPQKNCAPEAHGGPSRLGSTQMDSICMSDIETTKESDIDLSLLPGSSAHTTPQKTPAHRCTQQEGMPPGPSSRDIHGTNSAQTSSYSPDNLEEMAKRIAAVCKKGVWQAWRNDPRGLDSIYAISLWNETQKLMMHCGLIDVLELLLGAVTAELIAQGQKHKSGKKKLRVRLDGTIVPQSVFSKNHILLAQSILGILINLALHKEGAESCRRATGLYKHVNELHEMPIANVAHDAGRLLFLLDDCLHHKLGHAFSDLLVSHASSSIRQGVHGGGLVYVSYADSDEQLMLDITSGLRREGIQIVSRNSAANTTSFGEGGGGGGGAPLNVCGVDIPTNGPVEIIKKYGPGVSGMCRAILKADVVIVIATRNYFESYRCRLEAYYLIHPSCHTVPVLFDRQPQDEAASQWDGLNQDWMKALKLKASKLVNGNKATSVRTAVTVVKGILYTCGISTDSEWSAMKTIEKAPTRTVKVGGDAYRLLKAIATDPFISQNDSHVASLSASDGVGKGEGTQLGHRFAWDDTVLQDGSAAKAVVSSGGGKEHSSMHPDSLR